jgi:hypothetical protein
MATGGQQVQITVGDLLIHLDGQCGWCDLILAGAHGQRRARDLGEVRPAIWPAHDQVLLCDEPFGPNHGGHGLNGREEPSIVAGPFGNEPREEPP